METSHNPWRMEIAESDVPGIIGKGGGNIKVAVAAPAAAGFAEPALPEKASSVKIKWKIKCSCKWQLNIF